MNQLHRFGRLSALVLPVLALLALPAQGRAQWVVVSDKGGVSARSIAEEASKKLAEIARQGSALKSIAFTPGGGWVVLYDRNAYFARNIPDAAYEKLGELARQGVALNSIAFPPGGGWVILYDKSGIAARGIPAEALARLQELAKSGASLTAISFPPAGGWVVLFDQNGFFARNISDDAYAKLKNLASKNATLKSIAFEPGGGWVILHGKNGFEAQNLASDASQKLGELAEQGAVLMAIAFPAQPYLQLSKEDARTGQAILARLAHHKVPGISIALIQGGKIAWARGFGVIRRDASSTLTGDTLFQAASISKPVAALLALLLVQQNKLQLDQDLNAQLVSWKVPENGFTRKQAPTLRQLLSHSAGFNVHGFGGYPAGTPVPSLLQVLDGKPPANSPAIRVVAVPGSKSQYSGGGYTVLQNLVVDVTGTPFPRLMSEQVLGPLGMKRSSYVQPLAREWQAQAAVGHDSAGRPIAGNWHTYPEMAAAGLWTTAPDLALFVLALSHACNGDKDAVLTPQMARQMFTRQTGGGGLGIFLNGNGRSLSFTHNGANAGYRCLMIGFPATGQGAVLMTNSDNGMAVIDEFLQDLRREYEWPG